ncbi:MAG: hypothetical protein V3V99_11055 [candidate division Zixibacteria bacterium]
MTPYANILRYGLIAIIFIFLGTSPSVGKVIKWHDQSQGKQDLLLLGFGEITLHGLSISGNKSAFEGANLTLKEDFSSNYRLSLFANGNTTKNFLVNGVAIVDSRIGDEYYTYDPSIFRLRMSVKSTEPIWDGWRFTGQGLYDPHRQWELENLDTRLLTQPQEPARLELLMRLESEKYGVVEGGSLRPSFKGTKFSLHQRSLFGAYADLHTDRFGVEAVGGKLEGKAFREGTSVGIRANGTTGPFDLSNAPITRGSEEVKIQVRDRFDETTVLSTQILRRDIDYTADYLRGRILLHQPVASETPSSDPVYIVITYDYQRENNDELGGGRARVMPTDDIQISGSYLHRFIDDLASGMGEDEPENLLSADGTFKVKDHSTGYFEIASSENPNIDDKYTAVRAGAQSEAISNLKLNFDYMEIDDKFRSFTNSDLNPNKNQRRINAGGKMKITEKQSAAASFVNLRGLERNGLNNPYPGILNQDIYKLGYKNDWIDAFRFAIKAERREKEDRLNSGHEDTYQNRAIIDLAGTFEEVGFLGKLDYAANYEMILFRNNIQLGVHDANTNQLALTLKSQPSERAIIKLTQRVSIKNDRELDLYDDRQDALFANIQFMPGDNFKTLTTAEYKRYTIPGNSVSFWQDDANRIDKAGTFAAEYIPLDKIKAIGKIGRHDSERWYADSTTRVTNDFIQGQLTYFHTHHLSFNIENEYRRMAKYYSKDSFSKIWDLGLRVNWNRDRLNELTAGLIRRWQSNEFQPLNEIVSTSYILLFSGSVSFMENFFARGSVKEILLKDIPDANPLSDGFDDKKTITRLEAGYDSHSWFRVSLGYERIESDVDLDLRTDRNYTAQGVFVRFTGKM